MAKINTLSFHLFEAKRGVHLIKPTKCILTSDKKKTLLEIQFSLSLSLIFCSILPLVQSVLKIWQAKIANGGLVLGSSRLSILPQRPQKMTLTSNVVKIDSEIVFLLY